eukprot:3823403-Amphidinium_carterae.1
MRHWLKTKSHSDCTLLSDYICTAEPLTSMPLPARVGRALEQAHMSTKDMSHIIRSEIRCQNQNQIRSFTCRNNATLCRTALHHTWCAGGPPGRIPGAAARLEQIY